MKKILSTLIFTCLCLAAQAQLTKQLVVYRHGQLPVRISVSNIDYMTFEMPTDDPYEAVDLGLSVQWAAYNVGAEAPEQYGYYFAWGETQTKETYTEDNYLYKKNGSFEKIADNIAATDYDAAHKVWGYEWRMPTIDEVDELATRCTWTWTALNGISGYRIVGPSGNSIFLPAAGQIRQEPLNVGATGYYWTATRSTEYSTSAFTLNFTGYDGRWSANRSFGFPIRAVKE